MIPDTGGSAPSRLVYYYVGYQVSNDPPVLGAAPPNPITNVMDNDQVITYLYRALILHVRQAVLGYGPKLDQPPMGSLELTMLVSGKRINLTCSSGLDGTPVDYTLFTPALKAGDLEYLVRLFIPDHHRYQRQLKCHWQAAAACADMRRLSLSKNPLPSSVARDSLIQRLSIQ